MHIGGGNIKADPNLRIHWTIPPETCQPYMPNTVYVGDVFPSPVEVTCSGSVTITGTGSLHKGPVWKDLEELRRAGLGFSVEGVTIPTTSYITIN